MHTKMWQVKIVAAQCMITANMLLLSLKKKKIDLKMLFSFFSSTYVCVKERKLLKRREKKNNKKQKINVKRKEEASFFLFLAAFIIIISHFLMIKIRFLFPFGLSRSLIMPTYILIYTPRCVFVCVRHLIYECSCTHSYIKSYL